MKPRVFVTRHLPGEGLKRISSHCYLDIWDADVPPPRETLLERVKNVHGIISLLTDTIDPRVLGAAGKNLKVVSNYAVGFDNVDVAAATRQGIPIGHTPGVLTETTADLAFALLMSAARRIVEGAEVSRVGKYLAWSPTLVLGSDVHDATLGILGLGRIGKAMARRAAGFGMRVLFCDENPIEFAGATQVTFDAMIEASDYISIHTPLTEKTRGLICADVLDRMKRNAVIINTARGPVIDHDALFDALESGQIAHAALDVTEPEPLPAGHRLLGLKNCLIIPHLGSATVQTRTRMTDMACDNLLAGLSGKPLPNCVNPEVYSN